MKTANIKLYSFSELSESAKLKAIEDHREFLESLPVEIEDESGELKEYYGMEYTDSEIIENIEANEYIYFNNGEMTSCVTYTGSHPKAGITEFKFKGEIYTL